MYSTTSHSSAQSLNLESIWFLNTLGRGWKNIRVKVSVNEEEAHEKTHRAL